MMRSICSAVVALAATSAAASTSSYTALAFGPLGGTNPGTYFSSVTDIASDGQTFLGVLNTNQQILRAPGMDYNIAGTGSAFRMTPNGQTAVGGLSGQVPQRWDIASAVGSSISSESITWPGGPAAFGPAYAVNADATAFTVLTPRSDVVNETGYISVLAAFQSVDPFATPGAWRGMSPNEPIMTVLGSFPGNPSNAHRWNYITNEFQTLEVPAGASSITLPTTNAVTYDGSINVGTAFIGGSKPFWWDESGNVHALPLVDGVNSASVNALNYTGTLAGGAMQHGGTTGNRAYAVSLADGTLFDLNAIYSDAGLLPDGWILTFTDHISDDGSRIFCRALAPDGSTRVVVLEGDFVPTPGAMSLLALGGLVATRRRR